MWPVFILMPEMNNRYNSGVHLNFHPLAYLLSICVLFCCSDTPRFAAEGGDTRHVRIKSNVSSLSWMISKTSAHDLTFRSAQRRLQRLMSLCFRAVRAASWRVGRSCWLSPSLQWWYHTGSFCLCASLDQTCTNNQKLAAAAHVQLVVSPQKYFCSRWNLHNRKVSYHSATEALWEQIMSCKSTKWEEMQGIHQ